MICLCEALQPSHTSDVDVMPTLALKGLMDNVSKFCLLDFEKRDKNLKLSVSHTHT